MLRLNFRTNFNVLQKYEIADLNNRTNAESTGLKEDALYDFDPEAESANWASKITGCISGSVVVPDKMDEIHKFNPGHDGPIDAAVNASVARVVHNHEIAAVVRRIGQIAAQCRAPLAADAFREVLIRQLHAATREQIGRAHV